MLLVLFLLAAIAYLGVLRSFDLAERPSEHSFGAGPEIARRLRIYLEPLSVDPVSEAVEVRVDFAPGQDLRGARPDAADRDVVVILTTGDAVEERAFRAHEPMAPTTIRTSLTDGSIVRYPFDRYHAAIRVQAFEATGAILDSARPITQEVTVWGGVLGWHVQPSQEAGSAAADIHLRFLLRRVAAHVFFGLAAFGAMAVIASCSLAISFLVFLGRRKVEATLISALAALVFALPALRSLIPGAPPLGVWADLGVFLWAELAAVAGIALLVFSWARQGPAP